MKIIHDNGYTDDERVLYRELVYSNAIQGLFNILQAMDNLAISYAEKDIENTAKTFCYEAEGKRINKFCSLFSH